MRSPLTAAISRDEGEAWENIKDLEARSEDFAYAYDSVAFMGEEVVFTYYCHSVALGPDCWSLKVKIVPLG